MNKYRLEQKTCCMCDMVKEMRTNHGMCDSCASRIEGGEQW